MGVYGVGMEKTGTHSLASYLELSHQPFSDELIKGVLGVTPKQEAASYLCPGVSNLFVHYLDEIYDRDPSPFFILTIREPLSWIGSALNHGASRPETATEWWQRLDTLRKGKGDEEGLLRYWEWHNSTVLNHHRVKYRLYCIFTRDLPLWEYKGEYITHYDFSYLEPWIPKLCPTWTSLTCNLPSTALPASSLSSWSCCGGGLPPRLTRFLTTPGKT